MFLRNQPGLDLAGGTSARSFAQSLAGPSFGTTGFGRALAVRPDPTFLDRLARIDWTPDLGAQIGSRDWWRGLATCIALCAAAYLLSPGAGRAIVGAVPAPLAGRDWDEARAQGIAPLAWGGDTGRRMAANDLVAPLAEAPERPVIELSATLGAGDDFAHVLERAGIGGADADAAAALVARTVALEAIAPGTRIALTLGRRPSKTVARPLEKLAMRARFDLALTLDRTGSASGGGLVMTRQPITIDDTPLRVQGLVGSSLYRSARAAGVPAKIVEAYIKALATKLSIGRDVGAADSFDLIVQQQRAATGEIRLGDLMFAGIDQGAKKLQLVRWDGPDGDGWYDAAGQTQRRGFMGMPVAGHITSTFGMRMHPLLGFMRMHKGLDIGAPYGSPIYAVLDGVVQMARRNAGYGNFVKLAHAGGIASGYGHMSRFAVRPGERVARGQVIGYVGSTGLSTGPHLHWEVWRDGRSINPRSLSLSSVTALSGEKLRAFKTRVAGLLAVKVGTAR